MPTLADILSGNLSGTQASATPTGGSSVFGGCTAGAGAKGGGGGGLLSGGGGGGGAGGPCTQSVQGDIISGLAGISPGVQAGGSFNALQASGDLTLVQESPQAISSLYGIADKALQYVASIAGSSETAAATERTAAQRLAQSSTATTSEQFNKLILYVGIVAALAFGAYLYVKKG